MVVSSLPTTTNFVPLGAFASIHKPSESSFASANATDPTLILVCGWMSAYPVHLQKYCSMYAQMYPGATIVLVPSHLSIFWTPYTALRARYAQLIDVLEAHGYREGNAKILTHIFSNGGAFHLVALNRVLQLAQSTPKKSIPRSPSLLVIDSAPAAERFSRIHGAITAPIRNPLTRLAVSAFVSSVFALIWVQKHVLHTPSIVDKMMSAVRAVRALPWMDAKTPRLYIYSKADKVMPYTEIDAHALRTERDGIDVRSVCFEGSDHVSHARMYPQEYWTAIRGLWKEVSEGKQLQ
ncbi:hypothetical protein HMN09_00905800 [Mycena chlorophos]|uniref:DUF829-domain-containing protein n=1 Tax=Mycena chlorophos TaxID=658473 RepID=A0A8H6W824_MYCCL|nr:hypothetical protein HMN09_00905800 [Mycena chlorophos]